MAKAAPAKKTAKAAKVAVAGDKKKGRKTSRKETFSIYIRKVLKQVHPGEYGWRMWLGERCLGISILE